MTITSKEIEERRKEYQKSWKKQLDLDEIRGERGKYRSRTYMTAALLQLTVICRHLVVITWFVLLVAAAIWSVWFMTWGIIRMCEIL